MDDNITSLPRILGILHTRHVEHPARRNGHVRVMVLVPQVNHFGDARLNDHLTAVVAGEQRHVHLRERTYPPPTLQPLALAVLMLRIAFISA